MDCEKALELMSAELDGMCTEQERAALQAHLRRARTAVRPTGQLHALDEALQDAELEPPQALHDNVMRQIRKEKKPARPRLAPARPSPRLRRSCCWRGRRGSCLCRALTGRTP